MFEEFKKSSQHFPDTLTIKTCHGGFHLYYGLTDEQFNYLDNVYGSLFTCKDGVLYKDMGIHLDIKCNNQILIGPSYFTEIIKGERREFSYKIVERRDITPISMDLFQDIVECITKAKPKAKTKAKTKAKPKATRVLIVNINEWYSHLGSHSRRVG